MGAVDQGHRVTMLRGGVSRHHAFRVIPIAQAADEDVAAIVAYSMIKVGMHHPNDVAFGATPELRWAWRPARGGGIFASRPRRLTCPG